jgi:hypothetical protein
VRRACACADVLRQTHGTGAQPGADDLVPLLIYLVVRARPRRLHACLSYIQRYRTASKLCGEIAYYVASMVRPPRPIVCCCACIAVYEGPRPSRVPLCVWVCMSMWAC